MLGFRARWVARRHRHRPGEIVDAEWFRATALPMVPPAISIARQLIDAWVAEQT